MIEADATVAFRQPEFLFFDTLARNQSIHYLHSVMFVSYYNSMQTIPIAYCYSLSIFIRYLLEFYLLNGFTHVNAHCEL